LHNFNRDRLNITTERRAVVWIKSGNQIFRLTRDDFDRYWD
jgi:hypothetical protein